MVHACAIPPQSPEATVTFIAHPGFATRILACMLDSLVRVTRRARADHFLCVSSQAGFVLALARRGAEGYNTEATFQPRVSARRKPRRVAGSHSVRRVTGAQDASRQH